MIKIPNVEAAWILARDKTLPFEEVGRKKFCIGFGHYNIGYPLVEQYLLLHADYLAFINMQLVSAVDESQSYVICFCLLCNHTIFHCVLHSS